MPGFLRHRPFTPPGNAVRGFSELFKVLPLGGQLGQKESGNKKRLEHQHIYRGSAPERTNMEENKQSERVGVYLKKHLIDRADATAKMLDISRSELIRDALEYYIATLSAKESSKVITPELESVIRSRIALTEDRLNQIVFKLGVEIAMMNNILAATHRIDGYMLDELRQECTRAVASIGGRYKLEDAVKLYREE